MERAVVGPWAKEKLAALRRYLEFYTLVMKNQRWRTVYVDAYAGGGKAVVRQAVSESAIDLFSLEAEQIDEEQRELVNGSPRVALDVDNPFDRYVFVEPDPRRASELESLKLEYGNKRTISLRRERADEGIRWVTSQRIGRETHRGIAFLDPFGAGLEWSSVQALADTGLFEVVINFALNMAIVRMMPNSGEIPLKWRDRLDAYFGTADWYNEAYETHSDLFGRGLRKRRDYAERLLQLYRTRLRNAFGYVSQPMLIRNTKGAPLYYILWAGPHRKGLEVADHILSMGERLIDV